MANSRQFLEVMAQDEQFQAEVYTPNGFQDMNVLDHHLKPGWREWVPVRVALRMQRSDPDVEILDTRGPNPRKKAANAKKT